MKEERRGERKAKKGVRKLLSFIPLSFSFFLFSIINYLEKASKTTISVRNTIPPSAIEGIDHYFCDNNDENKIMMIILFCLVIMIVSNW